MLCGAQFCPRPPLLRQHTAVAEVPACVSAHYSEWAQPLDERGVFAHHPKRWKHFHRFNISLLPSWSKCLVDCKDHGDSLPLLVLTWHNLITLFQFLRLRVWIKPKLSGLPLILQSHRSYVADSKTHTDNSSNHPNFFCIILILHRKYYIILNNKGRNVWISCLRKQTFGIRDSRYQDAASPLASASRVMVPTSLVPQALILRDLTPPPRIVASRWLTRNLKQAAQVTQCDIRGKVAWDGSCHLVLLGGLLWGTFDPRDRPAVCSMDSPGWAQPALTTHGVRTCHVEGHRIRGLHPLPRSESPPNWHLPKMQPQTSGSKDGPSLTCPVPSADPGHPRL